MAPLPAVHTRASALALVREHVAPDDLVEEIHYPQFNADVSGGYAFTAGTTLFIVGHGGNWSREIDPRDADQRRERIDQFWGEQRHRDRNLGLGELGVWQRAAVQAYLDGADSVRSASPGARGGLTTDEDLDYADYYLVILQRRAQSRELGTVLRVFASWDSLLESPSPALRSHPCPLCGLPAIGLARYPASVCDQCYVQSECQHRRRISGYNTSITGGFEARHIDDRTVCEETTRSHQCWILGRPCRIDEARFGGVVIEARPAPTG